MRSSIKENCRIRHGYDAMDRIAQAGSLIAELLKDRPGGKPADDAVSCAFMDFMTETIEIGHELRNRQSSAIVKRWIEPKRDILLAELKRCSLDQTEDARLAFRKIDAVLNWVDAWPGADTPANAPIIGHNQLREWNDYAFDCPDGTWTARFEQKAWGKSANLILCFADLATAGKYRLSVFSSTRYRPRDGSHDFRNDAEPGELFELTTRKTRNGNPDLKSARKLARGSAPAAPPGDLPA